MTVKNIYCFDGSSTVDGKYIYYVTDKGDFVLYQDPAYLKEYLFPISDFYDVAKVVWEDLLEHKDEYGGAKPLDELFDVKPYEFHPRQNYGLIIATVIVIGGGVLFIVRFRKRQKHPSSFAESKTVS